MDRQTSTSFSAKLKARDRPFLDAERLRRFRESFADKRRVGRLSIGEVLSSLLDELRSLRLAARDCECGACEGIVDPNAPTERVPEE